MQTYRFLTSVEELASRHIPAEAKFPNDAVAVVQAARLAGARGCAMEVWQGARLIIRIAARRDPSANRPAARLRAHA